MLNLHLQDNPRPPSGLSISTTMVCSSSSKRMKGTPHIRHQTLLAFCSDRRNDLLM